MLKNACLFDEFHQVALVELYVLKQTGYTRACMQTTCEGVLCTPGWTLLMSFLVLVSGGFWSGFGPVNAQRMVACARHTDTSTTHRCLVACYAGAALFTHRPDSSFLSGAVDLCPIWPRTTGYASLVSETACSKLCLFGTMTVSPRPPSSPSLACTSHMYASASATYAKPEYGYAKSCFDDPLQHVSAISLCTVIFVHDTQHDHLIFQVSRALLLHSSRGPGFAPCCTVLSVWCSSFFVDLGQSLWGRHAGLPTSGPFGFKLHAVRSLVTSWVVQRVVLYPVQDGNPSLRHKSNTGAGVFRFLLNIRRRDLQRFFAEPLVTKPCFAEFLFESFPVLTSDNLLTITTGSANSDIHLRMQAFVTKVRAAMGWGGKGKGSSWGSSSWSPPQWSAPSADASAPAFAPPAFSPPDDGPGAAKFAYSLLYKEREKMREVLEEQRKKNEKQERDQEFQKLRQELLTVNKQPSIEDSIYRTMIADNPEKKQAESPEQDNKGMFGTMLKMMRAMTGSKDSKDHTPTVKAKKKRRRSSSSSRSASSEKPKKKHRSSKATSSKDKKKESTNKSRRNSSRKSLAASSDKSEEEDSDEIAAVVPLPLKIPRKAAPSSAAPAASQSNRKTKGRQFDANVQSMMKTYCKAGDEIDLPKYEDQDSIDTFTEEMCAVMKKYKVTVAEINQVLASNSIPLAKGGKTLTKQQKIEAILMHNVEPVKKVKKNNDEDDE